MNVDLARVVFAVAREFFALPDGAPSNQKTLEELPNPPVMIGRIDEMASASYYEAKRVTDYVLSTIRTEDGAAVVSSFRLGGVEAAREALEEAFRTPGDRVALDGAFVPFVFVRISPRSGRQTAVVEGVAFRREAGWHRVSRPLGRRLAEEPENELNPSVSPKVFEVSTRRPADAERVVELDR